MARSNRVRLSDNEIAQLKMTRQVIYGDDSVPMGVVVKRACEQMVADESKPKENA